MGPLFSIFIYNNLTAQAKGFLPEDVAPVHLVYALIGSVDVIFHQAEECKRVAGIDPADEAEVEAHSRTVEWLFLGSKSSKRNQKTGELR